MPWKNEGFALILTILFITLLTTIGTTLILGAVLNFELSQNMARSRQALYGAEGGVELIRYLMLYKEEGDFPDLNSALHDFLQLEGVSPYLQEKTHPSQSGTPDLTHPEGRYLLLMDLPVKIQVSGTTNLTVHSKGLFQGKNYRGIRAIFEKTPEGHYQLLSWQEMRE